MILSVEIFIMTNMMMSNLYVNCLVEICANIDVRVLPGVKIHTSMNQLQLCYAMEMNHI